MPRQFVAIAAAGERRPFVQGSGRLELAQAITSPDNPLTARVIVNRLWMYHFGEPLVTTPSDFGRRSEPPSHPELLDHLALRLIRSGWSLKQMHRQIMCSRAYQMASQVDAAAAASAVQVDPDNRLLWRMNRQRLDFESMRDSMLAVSHRLTELAGGRPVDVATDSSATCRTVYGLVDRQSLPSVFRAFDFASPDQSNERRPRTMMPQQALFALNSPFVMVCARSLNERADVTVHADARDRVCALFRAILARDPAEAELIECLEFLQRPVSPQSSLNGWEQLTQVLLASNEFMYVD